MPKHPLPADLDTKNIRPRWHVRDPEVLVVHGIGVVFRAVGLDIRERRFARLGLHEAVDPGLLYRIPRGVPHLAGDHAGTGQRLDPELGVRVVRRITDVRIDDQACRIERRGMHLEVQMIVGGSARVADERDDVAGFHSLPYLRYQFRVVVID